MSRSSFPILLCHEVCHSSKIYLLIDGLKLENGILKEVASNENTTRNDESLPCSVYLHSDLTEY